MLALLLLLSACAPEPATKAEPDPPVTDADHDGVEAAADCDDADPGIGAPTEETCDGRDEDCDGEVDEGVGTPWYADVDGDTHGAGAARVACTAPVGMVATADDCDDNDAAVFPGAEERCNGLDDDCDGATDEDLVLPSWWVDADGDGVGAEGAPVEACEMGAGWASLSGDCDDADPEVYPGREEDCNAWDDDCSGVADDGAVCPCPIEFRAGRPYLFCTTGSDWAAARDACAASGYTLVTVDDAAEDGWLAATGASYAPGSYWWTGGNDRGTEGRWEWVSGDPWGYSNFCPGEPNNSHGLECVSTTEEDCAILSWNGGGCWNDYPCDCASAQGEPYRYVCEG